jgi:hypothetical protein
LQIAEDMDLLPNDYVNYYQAGILAQGQTFLVSQIRILQQDLQDIPGPWQFLLLMSLPESLINIGRQ